MEPWQALGETCRQLKVRFPADTATDSTGADALLRPARMVEKTAMHRRIDSTAVLNNALYNTKDAHSRQSASFPRRLRRHHRFNLHCAWPGEGPNSRGRRKTKNRPMNRAWVTRRPNDSSMAQLLKETKLRQTSTRVNRHAL